MLTSLRTLLSRARRFVLYGEHTKLRQGKLDLIDYACRKLGVNSLADLGGVRNVDGGYTYDAMSMYPLARAVLVGTHFTAATVERRDDHPRLRLLRGTSARRVSRSRWAQSTP
jgi:hypothetical protein